MPRIALPWLALVGACSFDASYTGMIRCSDGRCPSGLVCHLETCVTMIPDDIAPDIQVDAPPAALTCADPGPFADTGGVTSGTTVGASSKMSSSCGGFVMNGPDRVYRIMMDGTEQLRVSITGLRKAYVLASCVEAPSTPVCVGNARATEGNPLLVTPPAGAVYVVVDDENAAAASSYQLTLTPVR